MEMSVLAALAEPGQLRLVELLADALRSAIVPPSAASRRAMAAPIPLVEPVTRAVRPIKLGPAVVVVVMAPVYATWETGARS